MYSNTLTVVHLNAEDKIICLCCFYPFVPTKRLKNIVIVIQKPFKDSLNCHIPKQTKISFSHPNYVLLILQSLGKAFIRTQF